MKTGTYKLAADEVLETLDDGSVRVRREIPFLIPVNEARRISSVGLPSNHTPIAALKGDSEPAGDQRAAKQEVPVAERNEAAAASEQQTPEQAQKAAGRFQRFMSWFSGSSDDAPFGIEPVEAVKEGAAATPVVIAPPVPSLVDKFVLREWREKWWNLRDALDDAMCDVTSSWGSNFDGRRAESMRQILDEFHAKALQLLGQAQLEGLKSAGEPVLPSEHVEASKSVAQKAGKMLSQANLADLQAAATALQGILDRAAPAVEIAAEASGEGAEKGKMPAFIQAKIDAKSEGEGGTESGEAEGEAGKGKTETTADGEEIPTAGSAPAKGEEEEQAMAEKKASEAALQALEAVKGAKTDKERAAAYQKMEAALKGTPDPKVEMQDAIKAAVAEAVKPLWDGLKAVAQKAIPGLAIPGDDSPAASQTAPIDNPDSPEQALRNMFSGSLNLGSPLSSSAPAGGEGPFGVLGAQKGAGGQAADPLTALKAQVGGLLLEALRLEASGAGRALPAAGAAPAVKAGGLGEGDSAIDDLLG